MTTVISRVYADQGTADNVLAALAEAGHPARNIDTFHAGAADLAHHIAGARVAPDAAATYAAMMKDGNTLVVVRAPVTPFGAARNAMAIVDSAPSLRSGVANENRYIREEPKTELYMGLSVMRDHPRFMSSDMNRMNNRNRGLVSQAMGWKLLSEHRTTRSASSGWFFSTKFLPFPLLKSKSGSNSAISGGKRMLYNPS